MKLKVTPRFASLVRSPPQSPNMYGLFAHDLASASSSACARPEIEKQPTSTISVAAFVKSDRMRLMRLLEAHSMPLDLRLTKNPEGKAKQGSCAVELWRTTVVSSDERRPVESGVGLSWSLAGYQRWRSPDSWTHVVDLRC